MNAKPLFSFPAESVMMLSVAWPVFIILPALGICGIFTGTLEGVLSGIILLALGIFITTRIPKNVYFYEIEIKVNYYWFRKTVNLSYSDIRVVRRTTEIKTYLPINVAELKPNSKLKKLTWHCDDKEFEEMKSLLKSHGVLWTKKE